VKWQTTRVLFLAIAILARVAVVHSAPPKTDYETHSEKISWPVYKLSAEKVWQLNPPSGERFDASALLLRKGELLTVNDRGHQIYRIQFGTKTNEADLILVPNLFSREQMQPFQTGKIGRWDCEGLAEDSTHRIYICEEANRWIFRCDPKSNFVERVEIDWSPAQKYFHPSDRNASFEGIAVGKGKLFVANERQRGRIFVVHLQTRKIIDDFTVRPSRSVAKDIHFSDLCWFEDSLWALLRENRVVVKIDPKAHKILAEFNFLEMEQAPEVAYKKDYPTSTFEGLAVDENHLWLMADNNGFPRKNFPGDIRPTLFKCARPDKQATQISKDK
jgi:hypothetical protein